MAAKLGRGIVGAMYGVLPGAFLVLLTQFVISGEWQLTIGANGLEIAFLGFVIGGIVGWNWEQT
ncbi:hypothetical protein LWC34_36935 [Kibdelosporangium philippinense]|uniref:Uncharacterized protein n=1 Tax=Kibdelosporangium philippinense TaxID=211113 RepID=A0ABS8ZPF7_9PSEU|nr:hypothetical protein [Kibdelosporangium philippinense]MCE7008358.1 hypothetical protein [Kibdelosporangium philippinense]